MANTAKTEEKLRLQKYGFGYIPKKRGNASRNLFMALCAVITALTLMVRFQELDNYQVILTISVSLLSLIIRTIVDRLCLLIVECFYYKTRYKGISEMIKACGSGILWLGLVGIGILAGFAIYVCVYEISDTGVTMVHVARAFSGIGFGTMIYYFFQLDTQSKVQVSRYLEEKETFVANGLAWHYFLHRLTPVLKNLKKAVNNSEWKEKLTEKTLFILLPLDCNTNYELNEADPKIEKQETNIEISEKNKTYHISVYKIANQHPIFVMLDIATPMNTLALMSRDEKVKSILEEDRDEQARLFYRTLRTLLKTRNPDPFMKWELIAFAPEKIRNTDETLRLSDCFARLYISKKRSGWQALCDSLRQLLPGSTTSPDETEV